MPPFDRIVDITTKLQAAHAAIGASPELDALHDSLKAGLDEHYGLLGLDADQLAQIEGAGTAARGGNPKDA